MNNRHNIIRTTILLALVPLALSPMAQAVSPPPDGGYAGGNTAEGQNALFGSPIGSYNTAIGFFSLASLTDASFNTGVGAGALLANIGSENTATGAGALLNNTNGFNNTANGTFTLLSNTDGNNNTAIGHDALLSNTTSNANTAIGGEALRANTSGSQNTANGQQALSNNTTGTGNVALGFFAGSSLTTGDNNIDIGFNVAGIAGESNTIRIGDTDITDAFIRGISGTTIASGDAVLVAANGHLGTLTSSARFKDDIRPMDKTSETIFSFKPVTFRYKKEIDPTATQQFGLVAEDVEKVNPNLVTRDENGKVNSVRYDQVNAMLLNEFLKQHKTVQDLKSTLRKQEELLVEQQKSFEATLAQEEKQIETLKSGLEKVSAQLGVSKSPPQMVLNSQDR